MLDATFRHPRRSKENSQENLHYPPLEARARGEPGIPLPRDAKEQAMQVQVSGHQIEITPALRDYVDARRERLTRRFDHLTSLNVVLEVEKGRQAHRAEGTLAASGAVLHADAVDGDMYAAIDALFDKLDAQARKYKDKLRTHGRDDIRDLA
jgi:putative sigma-54 modulation protein